MYVYTIITFLHYFDQVISSVGLINIKCHHDDQVFRNRCYAAAYLLLEDTRQVFPLSEFIQIFADRYTDTIDEHSIRAMKHVIEVMMINIIALFIIYQQHNQNKSLRSRVDIFFRFFLISCYIFSRNPRFKKGRKNIFYSRSHSQKYFSYENIAFLSQTPAMLLLSA